MDIIGHLRRRVRRRIVIVTITLQLRPKDVHWSAMLRAPGVHLHEIEVGLGANDVSLRPPGIELVEVNLTVTVTVHLPHGGAPLSLAQSVPESRRQGHDLLQLQRAVPVQVCLLEHRPRLLLAPPAHLHHIVPNYQLIGASRALRRRWRRGCYGRQPLQRAARARLLLGCAVGAAPLAPLMAPLLLVAPNTATVPAAPRATRRTTPAPSWLS
jgi:hypothetical protein